MSTLGRAGPRARTGQGSGRGQGCGYAGRGGDALPSCRGHLFIIVRLLFDRFLPLLYFGYMFISGIYLCFILFYVSTQCFISVGRVSVVCFPEDVQPCMLMGMPCSSFFSNSFFFLILLPWFSKAGLKESNLKSLYLRCRCWILICVP